MCACVEALRGTTLICIIHNLYLSLKINIVQKVSKPSTNSDRDMSQFLLYERQNIQYPKSENV